MNDSQKRVVHVTAIAVALMVLFPPYEVKNYMGVKIMAGYGFLFDLPAYSSPFGGMIPSSVDIKTLLVQILGVVTVGGLLFFTRKNPSKPNENL